MLYCPTCGKHYPSDVRFCPADQSLLQADPTIAGETPADPLIGRILDEKYRIEERLGVGGMGTVYRARHLLIDRAVALKVLNQRLIDDEAARTRFQREAKAAGRLQHLNAVSVTDFGQTADGYVYIVMELLEGRTLREILAREAPLETARSVSLMLQTAAAVGAAHEAGIIHRDLKPANILVTQSADVPAIVKVLDFGIAKLAAEQFDEDEPDTLTQVGAMLGTPRYMSPEQCSGLELTPAADVYSLGVIFYEMLTGMVPFSGSSPLAIALKHANELPRHPREIVASIPDDLERLVMYALEKEPSDRPANATEFRSALLETAEQLGLEHHALISSPDIEALRVAGVESPSGRLVVDISRLRQERALTSGSSEITVMGSPVVTGTSENGQELRHTHSHAEHFPRVNVEVPQRKSAARALIAGSILLVLMIVGVTLLAPRWVNNRSAPTMLNANVSPSPTASASPSPSLSPSPSPSPKSQASPSDAKKKPGKLSSFVNKVKRIVKKPF
jgi:serine/threonine-protein kinase